MSAGIGLIRTAGSVLFVFRQSWSTGSQDSFPARSSARLRLNASSQTFARKQANLRPQQRNSATQVKRTAPGCRLSVMTLRPVPLSLDLSENMLNLC